MKKILASLILMAALLVGCNQSPATATLTAIDTPDFPPTWTPAPTVPTPTPTLYSPSPSPTPDPGVILKLEEEAIFEDINTGKHYSIRLLSVTNIPPSVFNGYYEVIIYSATDYFEKLIGLSNKYDCRGISTYSECAAVRSGFVSYDIYLISETEIQVIFFEPWVNVKSP